MNFVKALQTKDSYEAQVKSGLRMTAAQTRRYQAAIIVYNEQMEAARRESAIWAAHVR